MKELADGVWQLRGVSPNMINLYLLEDVLVDASARQSGRGVVRQLRGHTIAAHALTHAHPDHQGSSKRVCETLEVPLWVGEADADAAQDTTLMRERLGKHPLARFFFSAFNGPGHPVDRRLREGDVVGGFKVLEVPGHSIGHLAYWRESDRVLVCGDVLANMDQVTGWRGLHEPKSFLTTDVGRNRAAARRLAALEPSLVCFGHGPPLRDTQKLVDFVAGLPA